MRRNFFICLLLAGITLAIYWPARHYDCIYFDDPVIHQRYTGNQRRPEPAQPRAGRSQASSCATGIRQRAAIPSGSRTNSGAQIQAWKILVNAAIHALNAALLFLVLTQMIFFFF